MPSLRWCRLCLRRSRRRLFRARRELRRNPNERTSVAKLLHLSRPSRRVREVVRTWLALRCQKRRRKRATPPAPTPPVPVITGGDYWWEASEPGTYDVSISWTIDYGTFPVASVEVFMSWGGEGEQSLGTVPSSDLGFYHPRATEGGQTLWYRVRYVFEDYAGPVVGDFSDVFEIYVPTEGG
jgi:hypothetical protein